MKPVVTLFFLVTTITIGYNQTTPAGPRQVGNTPPSHNGSSRTNYPTSDSKTTSGTQVATSTERPSSPGGGITGNDGSGGNSTNRDENYQLLIATADTLFDQQRYQEAIVSYQEALTYKKDPYAQDQIIRARAQMVQTNSTAQRGKDYQQLITSADSLYRFHNYKQAIVVYNEALLEKENQYPRDQIMRANAEMAQLNTVRQHEDRTTIRKNTQVTAQSEQAYQDFIKKADKLYSRKKYQKSVVYYNRALVQKEVQYPRDQITKANSQMDQSDARKTSKYQKRYQKRTYKSSLHTRKHKARKTKVRSSRSRSGAIGMANKSRHHKNKQKDRKTRAKKTRFYKSRMKRHYYRSVKRGDHSYDQQRYSDAIYNYSEALTVWPDEHYPKIQIEKATNALCKLTEESYNRYIYKGDTSYARGLYEDAVRYYTHALDEKQEDYPREQITRAKLEIKRLYDEQLLQRQSLQVADTTNKLTDWNSPNTTITDRSGERSLQQISGTEKQIVTKTDETIDVAHALDNHIVQFSGLLISDIYMWDVSSKIYDQDTYSDFMKPGKYNELKPHLINADKSTYDGIVVPPNTRLVVYSEPDFKGRILLDVTGPAIINNSKWEFDSRYSGIDSKDFSPELQSAFPQSARKWSATDMNQWINGSMEIIATTNY